MKKKWLWGMILLLAIVGCWILFQHFRYTVSVKKQVGRAISLIDKKKKDVMENLELKENDLSEEIPLIYAVKHEEKIGNYPYQPYLEFHEEGEDTELIKYWFVFDEYSGEKISELIRQVFQQVSEELKIDSHKHMVGTVMYAGNTIQTCDLSAEEITADEWKELESCQFTEIWNREEQRPFQVQFQKSKSADGEIKYFLIFSEWYDRPSEQKMDG